MQDPSNERWEALCKKAANEKDPDKLLELVRKINRLLDEKPDRLTKEAYRK
jgi:hypothetical protein